MTDPIKIRATLKGRDGEVRLLIPHPMESGLRHAPEGQTISAHYITSVTLSLNGSTVLEAGLGTAVSANPLFAFQFQGVKAGDKISVLWLDNRGQHGRAETEFGTP